jgi:hypothetical protein
MTRRNFRIADIFLQISELLSQRIEEHVDGCRPSLEKSRYLTKNGGKGSANSGSRMKMREKEEQKKETDFESS